MNISCPKNIQSGNKTYQEAIKVCLREDETSKKTCQGAIKVCFLSSEIWVCGYLLNICLIVQDEVRNYVL